MKRLALALLLLAPSAFAQPPYPSSSGAVITYSAVNPAGACTNGRLWWNTVTDHLWVCDTGAWVDSTAGGGLSFPLAASTGCVAPPYSFSGDTNAGLCLLAADDVVVQTAASGNSRTSLRQLASQGLFSHINGSGTNSSVSVTDTTAQLDVGSSTLALSSTLLTTSAQVQTATGCATPSFSFAGDSNAGLCLQAADQLVLQSGASGTARGALLLAYAAAVPQVFLQAINGGVQTGWYAEDPDAGPPKASVFVGGTEKFIFFSNPGLQIGVSAGSDPISIYPIGPGATSFEGIITSVDLTASRTWTLPNASGVFLLDTRVNLDRTITAGGTTGAQTINKTAGTVNFAAAATTLVVTNSIVTTSSIIFCTVRTNDATATIKNVVPAPGSFTITLTAAATAETSVGFFVTN